MRILLVEDDVQIARFITNGLREAGFAVDHATDGESGYLMAITEPFDVAIIDLMLPVRDGLSLIEALRRRGIATPVLILSAKVSVDDRVRGLDAGGDDYLIKPFSFTELLARINALIRRATGQTEPTTLTVGPLTMNLLRHEVTRDGVVIELQAREFSLLEYLMRNAGRVVSKTMIIQHVWNFDFDPQTNAVEVLLHRLRTKIDKDFQPRLIQTVRGVGYVLRES